MGLFNPSENAIHLKIVYYGPAFGGKTTNLTRVKSLLDPTGEQGVLSVNTDSDTTLFFDYLPLKFQLLDRYQVRIQGYTVPGQVKFNTTRRLVLKGADGVVFVADSGKDRLADNIWSLLNLHENLAQLGQASGRTPILLQYNKRDRDDAMAVADLDRALNNQGFETIEAAALRDEGVFESFRSILMRVIALAHSEYQLERRGLKLDQALAALDDALAEARSAPEQQPEPTEPELAVEPMLPTATVVRVEGASSAGADAERMLEDALQGSLELAQLAGTLAEERNHYAARASELQALSERSAHDLAKPVTALKNALHLVAGGSVAPESRGALGLAREAVDELARQIGELGALARDLAADSMEVREFDLADVVEQTLRRQACHAATERVTLRCSGELPRVRGNREALTSVLMNLVGNGIKYKNAASARRSVEVCSRRTRRGDLLLFVRDDGIGIPAGEIGAVFEKHRRGSNAAAVRGTGLGLFLAKEIVRAHGGRIGVRSREGGGSLFFVRLPASRIAAADARERVTAAAAAPPSPSKGRRLEPRPFVPT